jgi:hypothetical protein
MSDKAYYKFLDPSDLEKVLVDGTLMISSVEYFRKLESQGQIGDALDSASEMTTPEKFVLTENSAELDLINNAGIPLFTGKFAHVSGDGKIYAGGMRLISVLPGHIFCASFGELAELKSYFKETAERKYEACLRINSLDAILHRLFQTGIEAQTGKRFQDFFDRYSIGSVTYEAPSRSVIEGKMLEA